MVSFSREYGVKMQIKLNVFATNKKNLHTGYGRMEAGLIDGLKAIGVAVTEVHQRKPANGGITLIIGNPKWGEIKQMANTTRWLFTMSESNRVSDTWVNLMNTLYERVLVPTPELVPIYKESGVTIPISYVPLGVDLNAPPYTRRAPEPEVFTWLTYSLGDTRKGAELAMMAFNRLFGGNPKHRLLIKCRDNPQWLSGLDDPQMTIVRGETDDDSWHSLLASANAFIFPSRGEGFGLPPREATLAGLPTIATEWLGMWDVAQWGFPLHIAEMRQSRFDIWDANAELSLWAEPDINHLDKHMTWIAANYRAAQDIALKGREYLLSKFTWAEAARQLARVVVVTKGYEAEGITA